MDWGVATSWFPKDQGVITHWFPKDQGVVTHQFPMDRGVVNLWKTNNSAVSKEPGSRNSTVSIVPGNRFLYKWTFKPMLLPLKQHSFKKLFYSNINYSIQNIWFLFENFFLGQTFSPTSCFPKHQGVILKVQQLYGKAEKFKTTLEYL